MKVLISVIFLMAAPQCFAGPATPQDYDFKLGHWQIEARTMRPDQSFSHGSGTGHVFRNNVGVIQDELCIDMQEIPDVIGSTMRTLDQARDLWHITWVSHGNPSGTGTAMIRDGAVVELFPGSDEHGAFVDEMRFIEHSPDHYVAELNRTYENGGFRLECIWCYKATRMNDSQSEPCGLL